MSESIPIFRQLADRIEAGILDGSYPEGSQVPSINEFAAFLRINPATANKGIALLVDAGTLVKRRGIGTFVADGARDQLRGHRREAFVTDYIQPLVAEANRLGIPPQDILELVKRAVEHPSPEVS